MSRAPAAGVSSDRTMGRYELLRPLARGGMAEVYLARRRAAGVEKLLVIKRIRPERATDAAFLELFVQEARLSMSLAHQNIVPVFDFGRAGDQVYIAMERIEGKDLGSTLAQGVLPGPLLAAFIAAECLQGLDYAHRRERDGALLGVVHRDITPRNVLLSWSGEVKVTDFGIAALAGDDSTKLVGTAAYMAPEQARCLPVDARVDVYAVGLVLRELLTGQRARPGTNRNDVLAAASSGELVPWPDEIADASVSPEQPTPARPQLPIPRDLIAIVDRATAVAADDRYPDARAMLADLDAYIVGARANQRGEPPARQLAAWLAAAWPKRDDEEPGEPVSDTLFESFFEEALGSGTERSMAATAADESSLTPPRDVPPPVASEPRSGRRWGLIAIAGAAAVGVAVWVSQRGGNSSTSPIVAVTADADLATTNPPPPSDAPLVEPVDAYHTVVEDAPPPIDARSVRPPPPPPPRRDAGVVIQRDPPPPPPPATLRRVTINAKPWAHFTVDNDPTKHQTMKTLMLAPGPHTIHFSNPVLNVERTITLTVPDDRDTSYVEDLRSQPP